MSYLDGSGSCPIPCDVVQIGRAGWRASQCDGWMIGDAQVLASSYRNQVEALVAFILQLPPSFVFDVTRSSQCTLLDDTCSIRAKLHYTDTAATNTTNGQKNATSQHLDMSRCWALALRCGKFVVGLL